MALEKTSVSAYLLKPDVLPHVERAFSSRRPLSNGLDGWFYKFDSDRNPPSWLAPLSPYIAGVSTADIRTEVPAALILIKRSGLHFIVTFGHSWMHLKPEWLEPDFGRRVALNAVPPNQVLELNSEQVFAKWHVARERSPRATSFRAFGVDLDRDLVAALEGVPSEPIFGGVVRGSTSLRMKIHFPTLAQALDRAAQLFVSTAYKKRWPDIDNLMPVDAADIVALDQILDADLKSGKAEKAIALFAPSFRRGDTSSVSSLVFGRMSKNPPISPYPEYRFWKQHLSSKGKKPSLAAARDTKVHMLDDNHDAFEVRSVYECMGYEVSMNGAPFILTSGIWFRVERKFLKNIESALAKLATPSLSLPTWDEVIHEDVYNSRCCKKHGMLLFDKVPIMVGGGQSKFEFCDFLCQRTKTLFFAKIASRSSDCSHLVEQVQSTISLLFHPDDLFRKKLKAKITSTHPKFSTGWLDSKPRPGDWNLCLVLMGRTKDSLPLFAKGSIARLAKQCDEYGHPLLLVSV